MSTAFAPSPPPPPPAFMASNTSTLTRLTAAAAPPPPPPPPPAAFLNLTNSEPYFAEQSATTSTASKSQLLIDIERGVTLKHRPETSEQKSSNGINNPNVNNGSNEDINPVKNQLQAELCSTLKRRQNGQNKKPNFVTPKNSTINAIYNQLKVLDAVEKAMASEVETNFDHSTTQQSSPLPHRANTLPRPKPNADADKPKLMISHGRPNFVRPEPVFKIATAIRSPPAISPEPNVSDIGIEPVATNVRRFKSVGLIEPHLEPLPSAIPNGTTAHSNDSTAGRPQTQPNAVQTIQTGDAPTSGLLAAYNKAFVSNGPKHFEALHESKTIEPKEIQESAKYTNGASTITTNGGHHTNAQNAKTFTKLSQSSSGRSSPASLSASPLPPRKLITAASKQQIEEAVTATEVSTSTVKTIEKFERLLVSESSSSSSSTSNSSSSLTVASEQNEIQRKLQSLKTVDMHEVSRHTESSPAPSRKWTAKKVTGSPSMPTASPLPPRKAQPFKVQAQPQSPRITSPAIHHLHGQPNFDIKPIVSFAKDLSVTPNRYPDTVKVVRSASSSLSHAVSTSSSSSSSASSSSSVSTTLRHSESKENTYFSDLKFIINENGEVIQSTVTSQQHCH